MATAALPQNLHHPWIRVATLFILLQQSLALLLRQTRASPAEQLKGKAKVALNATLGNTNNSGGEYLDANVKVYESHSYPAVGSLILLMGIGGDHSWTMSQWWYLDEKWSSKDQKWCAKDEVSMCWFDDNDKAAVQRLRNDLRIVDAVGKLWYRKGYSWYKYQWWPDGPPDVETHEKAIASVFQIIEHESKVVGGYNRVAIAGMSQGADLALSVGVRFPHQLGMVISQRGMLHEEPSQFHGNLKTPFIIASGDADELIPLSTLQWTCNSIRGAKTPTFFKAHKCYEGAGYGCHGSFEKSEWKLLINAFDLMRYPVHERKWEDQIGHLTLWSSCKSS